MTKESKEERDEELESKGDFPVYFRWWFILIGVIAVFCMFGYAFLL
ncbi:hypothetical protein [Eupransor demetentiae]|uniref:Uncharacterized protein n=1 Tax=Eupransor demetentiae TaxID=3109584 RepID=A0ABM9N2W7_9LACO|nr:hypothetical protein R54876_GBNLAHCA_00041 [Lactobacillaceae bacterium LMG 33000]